MNRKHLNLFEQNQQVIENAAEAKRRQSLEVDALREQFDSKLEIASSHRDALLQEKKEKAAKESLKVKDVKRKELLASRESRRQLECKLAEAADKRLGNLVAKQTRAGQTGSKAATISATINDKDEKEAEENRKRLAKRMEKAKQGRELFLASVQSRASLETSKVNQAAASIVEKQTELKIQHEQKLLNASEQRHQALMEKQIRANVQSIRVMNAEKNLKERDQIRSETRRRSLNQKMDAANEARKQAIYDIQTKAAAYNMKADSHNQNLEEEAETLRAQIERKHDAAAKQRDCIMYSKQAKASSRVQKVEQVKSEVRQTDIHKSIDLRKEIDNRLELATATRNSVLSAKKAKASAVSVKVEVAKRINNSIKEEGRAALVDKINHKLSNADVRRTKVLEETQNKSPAKRVQGKHNNQQQKLAVSAFYNEKEELEN